MVDLVDYRPGLIFFQDLAWLKNLPSGADLLNPQALTIVILAAGRSTRFGDRHKALPPPWGVGLLARAAEIARVVGLQNRLVVTGYRAAEVEAEAAHLGLRSVHNEGFDRGMLSSILTGLAEVRSGAALLLPVDAALVSPQTVLALVALWSQLRPADQERALLIPSYAGQVGHPPLLGPWVIRGALSSGLGDMRAILASFLEPAWAEAFQKGLAPPQPPELGPIRFVARPDEGILTDIDTPKDFELALARQPELKPWPTPRELWTLLGLVDPGARVKRHCLAVARGALRLAVASREVWPPDQVELVDPIPGFLGGLIHDVDRSRKKHEAQAEARLQTLGWPRLGRIVGEHKNLAWPLTGAWEPTEQFGAMALYLADKYFLETSLVPLEVRFGAKLNSFDNPRAREKALARLANAQRMEAWFRERLSQEPGQVVGQRSAHKLEDLADELEMEIEGP